MIIEEILNNLKECDDFHNRCDYLLEHNEITYLLEYIIELKEENKALKKENKALKKEAKAYFNMYFDKIVIINKTIEYMKNAIFNRDEIFGTELLQILKGEK